MNCPCSRKEIPTEATSCAAGGYSFDDVTQPIVRASTGNKLLKNSLAKSSMPAVSFDSIDDARFVPGTILADR